MERDGTVGQLTGDPQCLRSDGADEQRDRCLRPGDGGGHGGDGRERLAVEPGLAGGRDRPEDAEVLSQVADGTVPERSVEGVGDAGVGQAETQGEPPWQAAWAVSAWLARTTGWRGYIGTTAVPTSMPLVSRPIRAATVRASTSNNWATQTDPTPAAATSCARRT